MSILSTIYEVFVDPELTLTGLYPVFSVFLQIYPNVRTFLF